MAVDTAAFKISLDTAQLKGGAVDAAGALQNLKQQLAEDTKAVRDLQGAMKNLQQGNVVNVQQFRKLQEELKRKKEAVASAQSAILDLGGGFSKTAPKAKNFRERLQALSNAGKDIGGPFGQMLGRTEQISKFFGSGAARAVLLGGALIGLGAAAVFAAKGLFDLAFSSAEARREENLMLQGQLSLTKGIKDTQLASEDLQETIDQVSGRSAASRSAIVGLGKDLYAAGLRGGALEEALDAASTKAAVQGPEAAKQFLKIAAATNKAGGSVSALAQKVDKELGGIAQAKLLSSAVQAEKFKEAVGGLFAGVKIDALLKARKTFTDMFSQSTAAGRAFKALLEPLGQSLVDAATSWTKALQKGIVRVLIWAVKIETAWLKVKLAFHNLLPKNTFEGFDLATPIIATLAAGLGILAVKAAIISAPFLAAAAAVWAIINTTRLLMQLWEELDFEALKKQLYADLIQPIVDFADKAWNAAMSVGGKIVEGIIEGIKSGTGALVDAMKNLASDAWSGFKDVLGIRSPSKEFANLGKQIPAGVEQGIEAGKPSLNRSIDGMVETPRLDIESPNLVVGGRNASEATANAGPSIGPIYLNVEINGADSPKAVADAVVESVEDKLRHILSTVSLQLGAT